jgi:transposase
MPRSHRAHAEWTPSRIIAWAATIGPDTAKFADELLRRRSHPEQGYRSCLGLIRLAKRYDKERVEAACRRAFRVGTFTQKSVAAILSAGLDREETLDPDAPPLPGHGNVRGAGYYH